MGRFSTAFLAASRSLPCQNLGNRGVGGEGKTKMYCVLLLLLRAVVQKGGNGTFSSLPRLLLLAFFAFCGEKKERKKKITLSHRVS